MSQPTRIRIVHNSKAARIAAPLDDLLNEHDRARQGSVEQVLADSQATAARSRPEEGNQVTQLAHPSLGQRLAASSPLLLFGGVAVGIIAAYLLISLAVGFANSRLDNLGYLCDQTCTTHLEAFVGHEVGNLPSHFLAVNLHGQITVVEFPGSDPSKAMTITGPYLFGRGEDKLPVQLATADLNGDGKPDLVISAKGAQTVYLNDGTAFRVMKPEERAAVEKALAAPTPGAK